MEEGSDSLATAQRATVDEQTVNDLIQIERNDCDPAAESEFTNQQQCNDPLISSSTDDIQDILTEFQNDMVGSNEDVNGHTGFNEITPDWGPYSNNSALIDSTTPSEPVVGGQIGDKTEHPLVDIEPLTTVIKHEQTEAVPFEKTGDAGDVIQNNKIESNSDITAVPVSALISNIDPRGAAGSIGDSVLNTESPDIVSSDQEERQGSEAEGRINESPGEGAEGCIDKTAPGDDSKTLNNKDADSASKCRENLSMEGVYEKDVIDCLRYLKDLSEEAAVKNLDQNTNYEIKTSVDIGDGVAEKVGCENDSSESGGRRKGLSSTEASLPLIDLIYWRDSKKTGVVFGTMLLVIIFVMFFSLISILSYLSLAVLTVSIAYRAYKTIVQAIQKSGSGHPFKQYLEADIEYSRDSIERAVTKVERHVNETTKQLRRLFLIESVVDSLKFFFFLWILTYLGEWFSGLTLIAIAVTCVFTLPKLYEAYQEPIDECLNLVKGHIFTVHSLICDKIPFIRKEKSQ